MKGQNESELKFCREYPYKHVTDVLEAIIQHFDYLTIMTALSESVEFGVKMTPERCRDLIKAVVKRFWYGDDKAMIYGSRVKHLVSSLLTPQAMPHLDYLEYLCCVDSVWISTPIYVLTLTFRLKIFDRLEVNERACNRVDMKYYDIEDYGITSQNLVSKSVMELALFNSNDFLDHRGDVKEKRLELATQSLRIIFKKVKEKRMEEADFLERSGIVKMAKDIQNPDTDPIYKKWCLYPLLELFDRFPTLKELYPEIVDGV
jgi:hypothetical protein